MNTRIPVEPKTRCSPCVEAMPPSMLVTGDTIPALHALRTSLGPVDVNDAGAAEHVRVVAIGVDLAEARSRREIRRAFRRHSDDCVSLCNILPRLAHLVFVTGGATGAVEGRVQAVGEEASRRTHALLEQACGAYVAVTVVVADGCDDPALLAVRIGQRTRRSPRLDVSVALTWSELSQDPLGLAGTNDLL